MVHGANLLPPLQARWMGRALAKPIAFPGQLMGFAQPILRQQVARIERGALAAGSELFPQHWQMPTTLA
jgi:hypothetical protein